MRIRFAGISGRLSAAVLAFGAGGVPAVQADALGDSLEQVHIRKATFAASAWEGYTNADGSSLYWDLLKQVYAPYGSGAKLTNMPWNRANKLMTTDSTVGGVSGEIPGVEGKLYTQLPIDIEYHGVMHAAKMPFSGRISLTGKRVDWRHSYNLIPAEQCDFTLVECVRPERCTEQAQNGELDFFLDEPDELEKQHSEAHLAADAHLIAQLPPGKEFFMTSVSSAGGRLLREVYDARVRQMAASGELRALYQRWNSEVPSAVQALSMQWCAAHFHRGAFPGLARWEWNAQDSPFISPTHAPQRRLRR